MLHFYHHPHSAYSRKVFLFLEEAGRPFDLRTIALEKGAQRSPDYLAVNPSGRVPAISDGDFNLAESNAILRYLARKFATHHLYPTGLREQAEVDMWWEFCANHINRPLMDLAWHKLIIHKYGGKPDMAVIAKAEASLARDLPVLNARLMGRHYLCGSEFSLADINLLPFAAYAKDLLPMDQFPYFKAWIELVSARQSWRNVVAYSG
jgi:glutathione S-transferase